MKFSNGYKELNAKFNWNKLRAEFKLNMETHKHDALEVPDVVSEFKKTGVAPTFVWLQHAESAKEVYLDKTRA